MYQRLFDESIGVAPMSTVDVDVIMQQQRKRVRLRRAGLLDRKSVV